jgi:hypothetical protein
MKRVSSPVFDGRLREWRPDLSKSKNVSEQLQPVHRRQLANTGKHVGELEGLSEKAIGAGGDALSAHFCFGIGTHDQNSRVRQMTFDVL